MLIPKKISSSAGAPAAPSRRTAIVAQGLGPLVEQVRSLVHSARRAAATSVNALQVLTNFEIGRLIIEHEQRGQHRAAYGKETLKHLAASLTTEFGRGFSESNLEYMRKFFLLWKERLPEISQKPSAKSPSPLAGRTASGPVPPISQKASGKLATPPVPFTLSWSHYVVLLSIKDEPERSFYEIESAQSGWSIPELKRQLSSGLYERLALSRDKKGLHKLASVSLLARD